MQLVMTQIMTKDIYNGAPLGTYQKYGSDALNMAIDSILPQGELVAQR